MNGGFVVVAIAAIVASAVLAAAHAPAGLVGLLAALAFVAIAVWAGRTALALEPRDDLREPRHRPVVASTPVALVDAATVSRQSVFGRFWVCAIGALALAGVVPLVALGRRARAEAGTAWTRGARLVTEAGRPVRPDDIALGGVTTVFPEGHVGARDTAALLIRVEDDAMLTNHAWAPRGNVAFSKICTHAGCPVAIYRHADHMLYCPCHQSEFSVLFGARPVAGPATRALPQLELGVDPDGYLVARGDFSGPVGPDDWDRPA
jgi:ubiquinol-cytochrome c reductase iron-sulfur subunit